MFLPPATIVELKGMLLGEAMEGKILYTQMVDSTPPLLALIERFLSFAFGRSIFARHLLATTLIIFQALFFGIFLVNNLAHKGSIYLPAFLYVCVCSLAFCAVSFSAELIACSFLLFVLHYLFRELEFHNFQRTFALHMGVFLGISSLLVFAYSIFLICCIFVMVLMARTSLRKILLLIFGFCLPHALLWTTYFWFDGINDLWINFYLPNISPNISSLLTMEVMLALSAVPLLYFGLSLFQLIWGERSSKKHTYIYQVYFFWLAFGGIIVFIYPNLTPHLFFPFVPLLIYFISQFFLKIKRALLAEVLFIGFLGALTTTQTQNHWSQIPDVYANIFPPPIQDKTIRDKKIMVLGEFISMYLNNKHSGFFVNWQLAKKYFLEHDDYASIITINNSFLLDPPDLIFDPSNLMNPILDRIPRLKIDYRKDGDWYWKRDQLGL